ncbi:MAG: hypothetical protein M1838_001732 [Thelocarpon superellum]|nr:MAG: hypothetical protein M1838_001732 [Thelocarpon superellum]
MTPRPGASGRRSIDRAPEASNEHSPLLSPRLSPTLAGSDGPSTREDRENHEQESKSTLYLILLVISIGGLQIAWCVELSNGTPYLLSLGLSKSVMALVWIAGPLSGTLVQPYVGIRSDNCRVPWGRRKPFMIGGGLATILSLLGLAWTKDMVHGACGFLGMDVSSEGVKVLTIITAVVLVYVLDFSINTVQAAIRAFIVDCAPTHQQESANAWAGRVTGLGNILGYLSGYVDLPRIMPFFGNTQFKVLCVIASLSLGSTVLISCLSIHERDPRLDGPAADDGGGVISFFQQVFRSIKRLPPQIRAVCDVQFFAWIGWFPFLFYITTYIGQLHVNPIFAENPHMSRDEVDAVWEHATRIGTFALLIFAFTSFAANMLLPFIVAPSYVRVPPTAMATSPRKPWLDRLVIPWLTLRRAWLLSHLLFALTMIMTFFIRDSTSGTVLVGVIGIAWACTLWAPFALIAAEISKREAIRRGRLRVPDAPSILEDGFEDQAGIVLGLHNVAIAAPQIIATVGSSLIFRALQKPRGTAGDDSVGWVLRAGAVFTLIAAYMATRVGEERENAVVVDSTKIDEVEVPDVDVDGADYEGDNEDNDSGYEDVGRPRGRSRRRIFDRLRRAP